MNNYRSRDDYANVRNRFINDMELNFQAKFQTMRRNFLPYKTNHPYLSGDVFADMCEMKLEGNNFEVSALNFAKSVFIKGDLLEYYLTSYSELFRNKVVVSGNSDTNFQTPVLFKSQIKMLYGQNLAFKNLDRCLTIPIGLENLKLQGSGNTKFHHEVKQFPFNDIVLIPPMGKSNPVREEIIKEAIKNKNLFTVQTNRLPRRKYFNLTRDFRFILVLEGNGFDTHRLWEVLYQGSFPILFSTQWSRTLDYLKLPIFAIENLNQINKKSLSEFWHANKNFMPKQTEALWAPFWERRIREQVANA